MAKRSAKQPGSLASLTIEAIHAELRKRQRKIPVLRKKLAKAQSKVDAIQAQIDMLAGPGVAAAVKAGPRAARKVGGPRKGRGPNAVSLLSALQDALKGKTMSVGEAIEAVRKAGYVSESPNFRTMVNQQLIKKAYFKKVARGTYTAA